MTDSGFDPAGRALRLVPYGQAVLTRTDGARATAWGRDGERVLLATGAAVGGRGPRRPGAARDRGGPRVSRRTAVRVRVKGPPWREDVTVVTGRAVTGDAVPASSS